MSPVRGVTFDKQVLKSKDHAHEVNYYYQGDVGVTKGCNVTENVDGNLVISEGYFIICGRLVAVDGNHIVIVPDVLSGTKYRILVFEIDLTGVNTTAVFNQGSFKIIESDSGYPTKTQQDLNDGGTIYQMEFARFTSNVSGNASLSQANKPLLSFTKYVTKTSPVLEGHPKAPTQSFNDNTTDIATDEFVQSQVRRIDVSSAYYDSNFTLGMAHIGKLMNLTPSYGDMTITLPYYTTLNIPVGSTFMFLRRGPSQITFALENPTYHFILSTDLKVKLNIKVYSVCTLIKITADTWLLFGELE